MAMKRPAIHIALLLAASALLQAWIVSRAVTPAQDAVRYARIAQAMARDGWLATVRDEPEHPLFPTLVLAADGLLGRLRPDAPDRWASAVQLAAIVPLVLAVVPVYFLLRGLFDERVALAGVLLLMVLSEVARLGASGLSDSTHLFLAATTLALLSAACGGKARRHGEAAVAFRPWLLLPAGMALGLTLLARGEALVLLPSLGLALTVLQARAAWRQPAGRIALGLAALVLGGLLIWGPYLATVQEASLRSAFARLTGRGVADEAASLEGLQAAPGAMPQFEDGTQMAFDAKESGRTTRFQGYQAAIAECAEEAVNLLQYWVCALAFWGGWTAWRGGLRPGHFLLVGVAGCVVVAATYVAGKAGYLAGRHLLLLTLPAVGFAAQGSWRLAERAVAWWPLVRPLRQPSPAVVHRIGWGVVAVAALACLPKTLLPLHTGRAAHREAGRWLAAQTVPGRVLDTNGLSGLYSGRETWRYDAATTAFRDPRLAFVVVRKRELEFDSGRSRTLRLLLAGAAEQAAEFADPAHDSRDNLVVYRWRPERFAQRFPAAALAN
jgi:hypothetical protein